MEVKLAWTETEWRKARGISAGRFHELKRAGLAPKSYSVASKQYISAQADAEWERRMVAGAAADFKPLPAKNPGQRGRARVVAKP